MRSAKTCYMTCICCSNKARRYPRILLTYPKGHTSSRLCMSQMADVYESLSDADGPLPDGLLLGKQT